MSSIPILKRFGFNIETEQKSIYPFSPVYKIDHYIVKRTQFPIERALNLVQYITYLERSSIDIVTPVKLSFNNPQQIEDECFVCYPFIEGVAYEGSDEQIIQAGELLGLIHSSSTIENRFQLEEYDVFDFNYQEVEEHIKEIEKFVEFYHVNIDTLQLKTLLNRAVENQVSIRNSTISWIDTPHDFKANNLIYKEKRPVLIDPDNAKWIPRAFDLALVMLLFHNELASAPNRVFTSDEWNLFLSGYLKHQTPSEEESAQWEAIVLHVFLDEVMWLMAEVEKDWKRTEQRELFVSLANVIANLEDYPL
ncbi:serine kinase [Sporosarcina sp. BI001-red]|uniref:phosphotransferase n=1 Tax=Sporosarcina sp. BI001-red TaxID=2282866 RepID=UPI000E2891C8|nr:phosphotransferase [Sporosarcina sp. BI001-red]REB07327.1 serine kinase [Sporosarcina sp. BI001-red]